MALTDAAIKQAKPQANDYWLSDERGLRLLVKVNGAKYWRLKYRHDGKQKNSSPWDLPFSKPQAGSR